jgi:hypothetical protein
MASIRDGHLQQAAAATGNGANLDVRGMSAAGVQLTITDTATVTFEGSLLEAGPWVAIPFTNRATGVESSTASASGLYVAGVSGVGFIRARVSAWTSGTVTALAQASTGGDPDQDVNTETLSSLTATIANGASLSGAVDLAGKGVLRLLMPAAWTAAAITFQTSMDNSTFYNLYKVDGSEYSVTVDASRAVVLPPADFAGFAYLKVRSGAAGAAVNQGAERLVTLVARVL